MTDAETLTAVLALFDNVDWIQHELFVFAQKGACLRGMVVLAQANQNNMFIHDEDRAYRNLLCTLFVKGPNPDHARLCGYLVRAIEIVDPQWCQDNPYRGGKFHKMAFVAGWNDKEGRTLEEVKLVAKHAIALAEADERNDTHAH